MKEAGSLTENKTWELNGALRKLVIPVKSRCCQKKGTYFLPFVSWHYHLNTISASKNFKWLSLSDLKYLFLFYLMFLHDFLLFGPFLQYFPPSAYHIFLFPRSYNCRELFCSCNSVTNFNHCLILPGHSVLDYLHFASVFLWLESSFFQLYARFKFKCLVFKILSWKIRLPFLTLYWPLEYKSLNISNRKKIAS